MHVTALVGAAVAQGRLELVVNNAGRLGATPLPQVAWLHSADLTRTLRTNVVAPLRVIQAALPHLRAAPGAVLNMTSDAAVEGYPGWRGHGAAKAALEQLSRVLAAEEPHLRVWWVDPGDMRTRMHQEAFPGEDISDRPTPESRATCWWSTTAGLDARGPDGRCCTCTCPPSSPAASGWSSPATRPAPAPSATGARHPGGWLAGGGRAELLAPYPAGTGGGCRRSRPASPPTPSATECRR